MRIDGRPPAALVAAGGQAPRPTAAAGFKLPAGRARDTAAGRSAAPLATLDAILMLQSEEDPRERRRRSARRGQDLLDALDGLKVKLLSGTLAPDDLRRLSERLARETGPSGDPGLDAVIAEVELRAKVEIAKREAARG